MWSNNNNNNKLVERFCSKYEAMIKPSSKTWRRATRLRVMNVYEDGPVSNQHIAYDDVPLAEIHLPTDSLMALIDLEDFKDRLQHNLMSPIHSSGTAYHMLKEYEEECHIRQTNPAVQRAYEQYQLLLALAR